MSFRRRAKDEPILQKQIYVNLPMPSALPVARPEPSSPDNGTLPAATVGRTYSQSLEYMGPAQPTWRFSNGTTLPPPGLSISPNGKLSGVPTNAGLYDFEARIEVQSGTPVYLDFALRVQPARRGVAKEQSKK